MSWSYDSVLSIRSGERWLVGKEGTDPLLRADVEVGSTQPPTTGWQFLRHNFGTLIQVIHRPGVTSDVFFFCWMLKTLTIYFLKDYNLDYS